MSESKLFDLGWKDNCFYYGAPDAFMCLPSSRRERRLYNRVEQTERGQNDTPAMMADGEDDKPYDQEDWVPPEQCHEDMLLPRTGTSTLQDLASHLCLLSNSPPAWMCLDVEQLNHYSNWVHLFDKIFFYVTQCRDRLFARGLSRKLDNMHVETAEQLDARLVLDYIPMLRRMAVNEEAADRFALESPPSTQPSTRIQSRRSTRRSKVEVRDHYFSTAAFSDYFNRWGQSGLMDVHHVTNVLSSRALGVEIPNSVKA